MKLLMYALIVYCIFLSACAPVTTHEQATPHEPATPLEVVELWNTCYGTADMDRCADITTAGMRENIPKAVWVYDTWKMLNEISYRKESNEVIQKRIDDDAAYVLLQTRIYVIDGYVSQKELFTLLKIDGVWLIDDLRVGDEVLDVEEEQKRL